MADEVVDIRLRGLQRLLEDYPLYAGECLKIVEKKGGKPEPFILNPAQMFVHKRLEEQVQHAGWVRALILKGRQQGVSTYTGGRFYHRTSTHRGTKALIIAHEAPASNNLFAMVKRFHEHNPLAPSVRAANGQVLEFGLLDSGYKVATAGTKDTGRSGTFQLVHASEYAFWPFAEIHSAGLGQTVADLPGTEIIKESTANGVGNAFHEEWQGAEHGDTDYQAIFVPWYWQKEYARKVPLDFELSQADEAYMRTYKLTLEQMAWRAAKIASFGPDKAWMFKQEYPAVAAEAFIAKTDDPYISVDLVMAAVNSGYRDMHGPLIIGVDPAEMGKDRTAIVFRRGKVVYRVEVYREKTTMETTGIVANIIREHAPDAVFVDSVGIGAGIYSRLQELGFTQVYSVRSGSRARDPEQFENRRAEMWHDLKRWLEDAPVRLPNMGALISDISAPKYSYESSGSRLRIEKKKDMAKRGVRSPDIADAICLTFAEPVAAARHDDLIVVSSGNAGPASSAGY
ncbi:MAG: hypothetical protein LCH90_19760 [Proteobacteria bacterium]|nr:hypothetical protein [Pseudomonadota bacterium]